MLADSAGHIFFDSAGRGESAAKLGAGEWIRSVITTQRSAVSNLFRDPVASGHFFMISVPVTDYGVPKYVLAAQVRSSSLSDILRRQRAPPGGVVSLVDRVPRIMARSRNELEYVGTSPSDRFKEAAMRMSEGSFEGRLLEGVRAYSSMSRSPVTGWTVGVGMPADAIETPIWRSIGELALAVAALLALGIASALILGRALVNALTSAAASARGLARGEVVEARHSRIVEAEELSRGLIEAGSHSRTCTCASATRRCLPSTPHGARRKR